MTSSRRSRWRRGLWPIGRRRPAGQLAWVDRSGTARGAVGGPDGTISRHPRVSPDGRRVVVTRTVQGNTDLWLLDGARTSRFTFDADRDPFPLVARRHPNRVSLEPDGCRSTSIRSSRAARGWRSGSWLPTSQGRHELVGGRSLPDVSQPRPADERRPLGHADAGDRTPAVFLKTPFREVVGRVLAGRPLGGLHSNESGRLEIYVRPFVPPGCRGHGRGSGGGQWQVSTAGGIYARLAARRQGAVLPRPGGRDDGGADRRHRLYARTGRADGLFPTRIVGGGGTETKGRHYDVARDGRFLINTVLDDASAPITLLMNWRPPTP